MLKPMIQFLWIFITDPLYGSLSQDSEGGKKIQFLEQFDNTAKKEIKQRCQFLKAQMQGEKQGTCFGKLRCNIHNEIITLQIAMHRSTWKHVHRLASHIEHQASDTNADLTNVQHQHPHPAYTLYNININTIHANTLPCVSHLGKKKTQSP